MRFLSRKERGTALAAQKFAFFLGGSGLGTSELMVLEAVLGELGGVLRFEAGNFGGGFAVLREGLRDTEAGFGVFLENLPIMCLFFHFVLLVFDAKLLLFAGLRFEAIFGLASFGSYL
jgi:hypothetical protein